MGFQNENGRRIVFDCETAPLPEAADYLVEPVEAPANYRDEVKIAAYINEKKAEQLAKCSLDPDLCRVVAVAVQREEDAEPTSLTANDPDEERFVLDYFWGMAGQGHLVGFNCLSFDLPVLLRRSLYLGVKIRLIQIDRFKHPEVTDLLSVLSFNGVQKLHSLNFYAKRFGCTVTDPMDGAGIGLAVLEGRWDDVHAHVRADVQKTAFIAEKCGYFRPVAASVF